MGGWYDTKNNRLDFNSSKINSDGALATKAIGDAFLGVAGVVEDRKKLDILEADAKIKNEKNNLDLSKAYAETTQKAIDDTYLNYVDTNTGKFNQDKFDQDNVGLPMNQVSLEAKLKQKQLENAYSVDLEKTDKKAQEQINSAAVQEAFKYGSKDDFKNNISPELLDRIDAVTLSTIDKHYSDKDTQAAKLANEAARIENAISLGNSKLENEKLKVQIEQEKLDNKKNKPKELSAADSNSIFKGVTSLYGGTFDPATEQITGVDATQVKNIMGVSAKAAEMLRTGVANSHPEAVKLAFEIKKAETETPPTPPVPEPTPAPKNDLSELHKRFGLIPNK